ncbi:MAG: NAD+ synthase [Acidimicrobiales bacterium]
MTVASLRIALCQVDIIVGALDTNVELILGAVREAEAANCDVAVFPELTIPGYPPEDLVYKRRFIEENLEAVKRVAAATGECAVIVGYLDVDGDVGADGALVDGGPFAPGAPYPPVIYNAAAICANGEIKGTYRKHALPNYDVFDEKRYYTPGTEYPLWSIAGVNVGVSICEDMWIDDGPVKQLADGGAQMLININASPYHQTKVAAREEVMAKRIAETHTPLAYVNLVGGQDELVFDGGSVVLNAEGELVARAGQFVEQVHVADFAVNDPKPVTLPLTEVTTRPSESKTGLAPVLEPQLEKLEEIWSALVLGTRDYVRNNGFSEVCFGLSGGIDSAITAVIAAEALGPENVHAVMMPSRYSSDHSLTDSEKLCQNLGINSRVIAIEPGHASFLDMLQPSFGDDPPGLTGENLQSRIRGILLMALSNKFGWLVLTTGNKSELAVGYSTLYGDTAGAFAVIKDAWKLQVYALSEDYNRRAGREIIPQSIITKAPSAELRPDQRDDQSLPPYEVLDPMLVELVERNVTAAELIEAGGDPEVVRRIARLVDIAEFKRRQSPLGTRITKRAFGRDRRMPITNHYRGNP